jgi:putative transposase
MYLRYVKIMKAKPKSNDAEHVVCAMRLRVYPSKAQESKLANALHAAHVFRNEAVSFAAERRKQRGAWVRIHPHLRRASTPEEFAGSDALAASKWLTDRLVAARKALCKDNASQDNASQDDGSTARAESSEIVASQGGSAQGGAIPPINSEEIKEIDDSWLLTVHRTVFDQVLQDLEKTNSKAIKDRVNKLKKPASFPVHHKWSYATSIRMQINAERNPTYKNNWEAGELFIPSIGNLRFLDKLKLPKTPAKLITIARDAAGHFYASFICAAGEGKNSKRKQEALPVSDELFLGNFMPKITGLDFGLSSRTTDSDGKKSGRTRYTKHYEGELRFRNKGLSRKTRGSNNWKKEKQKLGALHVNIANQREVGIQFEAQQIAKNNAIACIEDMWLAFMLKTPHLAGSAADVALGHFTTVLEREMDKRGHLLIKCGRFDASTKTCFECKAINKNITLSDRTWTCPGCGAYLDRDINAAKNILVMALERAVQDFSVLPESGDKASLSQAQKFRSLHPDLRKFISCGGLTALLERHRSSESRQGQVLPLEVSGPTKHELCQ